MSQVHKSIKTVVRSGLPLLAALLIGLLTAGFQPEPSTAQAEVRKTQRRAAFQSGAARSETLLREIASTLKQIDARLQRIEKMAARNAQPAR